MRAVLERMGESAIPGASYRNIAGMDTDLAEAQKRQSFREDLYSRPKDRPATGGDEDVAQRT
jgi:transcriptional regulator with GAF, ATPase, and Fis domain